MRNFDLTPLLRTTVGFDRMARALDTLADEPINSFPPYNIEAAGPDAYRITMAVAGFGENDIDITAQDATESASFCIAASRSARSNDVSTSLNMSLSPMQPWRMVSFISTSSAMSRKRRSRKRSRSLVMRKSSRTKQPNALSSQ